jgi:hypothetical protein
LSLNFVYRLCIASIVVIGVATIATAQTTLPRVEIGPVVGTRLTHSTQLLPSSTTEFHPLLGFGGSVSVLGFGLEGTVAYVPANACNSGCTTTRNLNNYSYDLVLTHSIVPVTFPIGIYALAGGGVLHYPQYQTGQTVAAHNAKGGIIGLGLRLPIGRLALRPEVRIGGAQMGRIAVGGYVGF